MSLASRFISLYKTRPLHAIGIGGRRARAGDRLPRRQRWPQQRRASLRPGARAAGIILCPVGVLVGLAFGIYEEAWEVRCCAGVAVPAPVLGPHRAGADAARNAGARTPH